MTEWSSAGMMPGVVVEDVETAERVDGPVDHHPGPGLVRDVGGDRDRVAAGSSDLPGRLVRGRTVEVDRDDPGALLREHEARDATHAAARPP